MQDRVPGNLPNHTSRFWGLCSTGEQTPRSQIRVPQLERTSLQSRQLYSMQSSHPLQGKAKMHGSPVTASSSNSPLVLIHTPQDGVHISAALLGADPGIVMACSMKEVGSRSWEFVVLAPSVTFRNGYRTGKV